MDYETYLQELESERYCGLNEGIYLVMKWLESGLKLEEYLTTIEPSGGNLYDPKSHWARIARALGRESEIPKHKITKKIKQ